jgi:crotonobetainyl-CoA:carnitine CoA-transferase CaiB-like acyl-CoA transferase
LKTASSLGSSLNGLVLLEIGNELGDYAAMLLAGLGVDAIKVEPPGGARSRWIGPFAQLDAGAADSSDSAQHSGAPNPASPSQSRNFAPDSAPENSLFFWRYNLNKRSAVLDLDHPEARPLAARLAQRADIVLLSGDIETVDQRLELWRELAR